VGFVVFIAFPVLASLGLSLVDWKSIAPMSTMKFTGLSNFVYLLSGSDGGVFRRTLWNTVVFTVVSVPVGIAISLALAAFMDKHVYGSKLFRFLIFVPYVSSVVASVIVWQVMLQPSYGPVNELLKSIGVANPPSWFVDPHWAMPAVIAFQVWQTVGYNVVVYMAGLKSIPAEVYEAAMIDGAGQWRTFTSVTVPMVSPTTFFLTTMGVIGSFKVFDLIYLATGGGPGDATSVISFYIYQEAFVAHRLGTSSAAAWVMFAIIFAVTMVQLRGQKKWVTYE
jgi:multiple sugar transport system permease protein